MRNCVLLNVVVAIAAFAMGCLDGRPDLHELNAEGKGSKSTKEIAGYGNSVILSSVNCTSDVLTDLTQDSALRSVTFQSCTFSSSEELLIELTSTKNLQTLRLIDCEFGGPLKLANLAIENLEISSTKTSAITIEKFQLSALRELRCSGVALAESAISDLHENEQLTALVLKKCGLPEVVNTRIPACALIRIDDCNGKGVASFSLAKAKMKSLDGLTLPSGVIIEILNDPTAEMLSFQRCGVLDEFRAFETIWSDELQRLQLDLSGAHFSSEFLTSILQRPKISGLDVSGLELTAADVNSLTLVNADWIVSLDVGERALSGEWRLAIEQMKSLRFLISTDAVRLGTLSRQSQVDVSAWESNTDLWFDGAWR